jgi:hypothetical protein
MDSAVERQKLQPRTRQMIEVGSTFHEIPSRAVLNDWVLQNTPEIPLLGHRLTEVVDYTYLLFTG